MVIFARRVDWLLILAGWYVFVNRHLLLSNHKARIVLVLSVVGLVRYFCRYAFPVGRSLLLHQTDNQANGSTELRLKSYGSNMRLFVSNPLGRGHGYASPAGRLSNNNSGSVCCYRKPVYTIWARARRCWFVVIRGLHGCNLANKLDGLVHQSRDKHIGPC